MRRAYVTVAVCQGIAAAAAIAALRFLATYVSPETFGRYTLYQSVVSAGALFLVGWPNAALLRFGREEWTRDGRMGTALAARAMLFITSISIGIILTWAADPWLRKFLSVSSSPLFWVSLGLITTSGAELAIYISQAAGRPQAYGYSPLITRVGFLLGVGAIPLLRRDVAWTYLAAWVIAASTAAATTTLIALPRRSWSGFRPRSPALVAVLKYSWTLPFAAISTYVVNWVDTWVIRGVAGLGSVGIYNWGYQTTAIAALAFAPAAAILTPRVIDARVSGDRARINRYSQAILPIVVFTAGVVALATTGVFPVLHLIASPAYAGAYPVILILMIALPFQLLGYLVTPLGNAYERLLPKFVLVSIAVAIINALADFVLVPRMGITGAAVATTTAFALGGLLQVFVVRATADFESLWRYTAPAWILVPAVAALWFIGPLAGSGLIVAGLAAAACISAFVAGDSAGGGAVRSVALWFDRLPRALTLSDATDPEWQ